MDSKPFFASLTFWGAVIAVVSQALPALGVETPPDFFNGLAEEIVGVVGGVIAIIGRFRARTSITIR